MPNATPTRSAPTFLLLSLLIGISCADVPAPLLTGSGPGLVVPCDGSGTPSTYGDLNGTDNWDYAVPGIGTAVNENDRNIYYLTNSAGVRSALNGADEWVAILELRWNVPGNNDDSFYAYELAADGGDILRMAQKPGDNNFWLEGTWNAWLEVDPPQDQWFTLAFHYQPNHPHPNRHNGAIDIYIDDQIAYNGIEAKNGVNDYDLSNLALKGYNSYDEITVGPTSPTPQWYPFSDRYTNWQAARPFMLGALHNSVPTDQLAARAQRFKSAGLNTLIWWKPGNAQRMFAAADEQQLQWACGSVGGTAVIDDAINNVSGCAFVMAGDEPGAAELPVLAAITEWVHTNHPELPAFTNISINKIDHDLFITTCNPDIFSFDNYPLYRDGSDHSKYLYNVNRGRTTSQNYQLPFWMFLQAYGRPNELPTYAYRIPDEADMRWQVFTFLAHGGQGIMLFSYFGHVGEDGEDMVLEANLPPDPDTTDRTYEITYLSRAWHAFHDVASEIINLSPTLINLRSVGAIGYVGTIPSDCSGYATHGPLQSFSVLEGGSAMVGWFVDNQEQEYFMIVNLTHGADQSKQDAARTVRLMLDGSVTQIERRSRLTGQIETLATFPAGGDRYLDLYLPGGTGDLLKWSNGQPWQ